MSITSLLYYTVSHVYDVCAHNFLFVSIALYVLLLSFILQGTESTVVSIDKRRNVAELKVAIFEVRN